MLIYLQSFSLCVISSSKVGLKSLVLRWLEITGETNSRKFAEIIVKRMERLTCHQGFANVHHQIQFFYEMKDDASLTMISWIVSKEEFSVLANNLLYSICCYVFQYSFIKLRAAGVAIFLSCWTLLHSHKKLGLNQPTQKLSLISWTLALKLWKPAEVFFNGIFQNMLQFL